MTEPQTWTLVAGEDDLQAMMRVLRAQPAIAVDTESNSLYAYHERVCLIQISVPGADYIVDPLVGLDLSPLDEVFADPDIQKVFHAAEQDIAGLKRDFGFRFANLFDTMRAARILGWPHAGLAALLREHFGVCTDKRYQRYNWGQRPLSPEALRYAAGDTRYLLPLRDRQMRELERTGRVRQAAESFARLAQTPPAGPHYGPDAFWRMRAVHSLNDRERAILWQLYLWRDELAASQDRPPFRVMSDDVLVRLARARPRTLTELAALGRFPGYWLRRHGSALLEAVARGENGPVPEPPDVSCSDSERERFQSLREWRRGAAEARGVAPDVILPNAVLRALAMRNPQTMEELAEVEGIGPWACKTWGPEILQVLQSFNKSKEVRQCR
ncbi:MAG: ribonuclease D [Anaerolineae bacterium]